MQRGSDRLNVHRDDEMKHELQGLLRSGRPTRTEEWHDPEPAADDDPPAVFHPVPPRETLGEQQALRFELARRLGRTAFPARRGGLLRRLRGEHAPDELLEAVRALPRDRTYRTVQELAAALHPDGA